MDSRAATFLGFFDDNRDQILADFFAFLKIKSISTEVSYQTHVEQCATWLERYLADIGLSVQRWETAGHPIVYGEWLGAGANAPTVLFYQHYDVQPVDPVELWDSAPFEPTIHGDEIYCRGAQDNKGQCFYVLNAIRAYLQLEGKLPVNIKVFIEGEEEGGSQNTSIAVASRRKELQADYFFIPDVVIHSVDQPAVTIGYRGMVQCSIELTTSNSDLHSGGHGGIAYNANRAIVELLAKLKTDDGSIAIPGFYDDVLPVSAEEKAALDLHFDDSQYQQIFGAVPNGGEKIYTPLENAWLRPTAEINGVWGGYTGDGFKTVIPAKSWAKLSFRLVPNQDPQKITALVKTFLQQHLPEGCQLSIAVDGHSKALRTSPNHPAVDAVAKAYQRVCGIPAKRILAGGTIPVAADLAAACGADAVLYGYGLPSDNIHAPNEHFGISRLRLGLATTALLIEELSKNK